MRIGLYMVALHHLPLASALGRLREWGIGDAEVASGGFVSTPHCATRRLIADADQREAWLGVFRSHGIRITALNSNGNPLHPDPAVGPAHRDDIRASVELAALIGVDRVVVMPGGPGSGPTAERPTWSIAPWDSGLLDVRDYQWQVAVPFWREAAAHAAAHGIRLCLEMHPHTVAYNPPTLERLIEAVGSDSLGVNLDSSHLFWQGIDPLRAIARLSGRIWHAAAKDTLLDAASIAVNGVLDDRYTRPDPTTAYALGASYVVTVPPDDAPWKFAAAGRGHDAAWWGAFVSALQASGYDDSVSIENEDWDLLPDDAIPYAAGTLRAAIGITEAAS